MTVCAAENILIFFLKFFRLKTFSNLFPLHLFTKRNCMLNTHKHHLRGSDGTEAWLMRKSHMRHVYHARDHASVRLPGFFTQECRA